MWVCHQLLLDGVESNAIVESRGANTHRNRKGRLSSSPYSMLRYNGYRGRVSFLVTEDSVPVIYLRPGVLGTDPHTVLVGRKSDGFFNLISENHGGFAWLRTVFFGLLCIFTIPTGLLCILIGLGLRAGYPLKRPSQRLLGSSPRF